jgi:hypothetical protein
MPHIIWTETTTNLLFELVTPKFGPFSEWDSVTNPGRGLKAQYDEFVATFSALIGCGPRGIEMKIGIASGPSPTPNEWYRASHNRREYMEVALAALRAGFINESDLAVPTSAAVRGWSAVA